MSGQKVCWVTRTSAHRWEARRRTASCVVFLVAGFVLLSAGCGGGQDGSAVATATATQPTETPAPGITSPPTATPDPVTIYIVEDGDTAWAIAGEHGITLADLAKANGMTAAELDHLQIGQELRIPR